jgi:hypothetical protein
LIVVCNGPVSTNERRVFVLALGMRLTSVFSPAPKRSAR